MNNHLALRPGPPDTLRVSRVHKSYATNAVLRGIDLEIRPGDVIALAGENGAGKSTLLKIIAGLESSDDGQVTRGDKTIQSVHQAREQGVTIVPQELAPVPDMAVYENIFLGRELTRNVRGLDRKAMIQQSSELLQQFGLDVDPRSRMRPLSTATQQLIEIIKSVSAGASFILLDEPTSALAPSEVEHLYATVRRLQDHGVGMVFTTHKMEEIRALSSRVVVLRDGQLIENRPTEAITDAQIVEAMIGRELKELFPSNSHLHTDEVRLALHDVKLREDSSAINLEVRAGEIVALAGLMGAGRTSLIHTIFGIHPPASGTVKIAGQTRPITRIQHAIDAGIALVPEDRKVSGAVLSMSILDNTILPNLSRFSSAGWVRKRRAKQTLKALMSDLQLKYIGPDQEVATLSGGNQQKVVFGKWLTRQVDTFLLDEPTRGVDVGARSEIYKMIVSMARDEGRAVLLASSDMAEVIGLADRILVMREHTVVKELHVDSTTSPKELQQEIFEYAAGLVTAADGKAARI